MFKLIKQDKITKARLGEFTTNHGTFTTPAFFPVATQGALKGITTKELYEIGADGLLVNAYHLFIRPGIEVIKKCGGLHKFMNFDKTIITDSGGYQIFSLKKMHKITDAGVEFQSHVDGKTIFLSPQDVIQAEIDLKTDVAVPLDECIKLPAAYETAANALRRTLEWAKISREYFEKNKHDFSVLFREESIVIYEKFLLKD
jgi:queuine tRNA-ribosyltransferase